MKRVIIVCAIVISSFQLHAGAFDSLYIGFCGGYDSYNTFRGELYLKTEMTVFKLKSEIKMGINNRSYDLTFDGVKNLNAQSAGIFGDFVIYPFNKGLFAGLRWEFINFNWLTEESKSLVEYTRGYSPTSLYTGTCGFFQLGYTFRFSKNFNLKIFGQPGVQQFKITNGSSSSGSYVQVGSDEEIVIEDHYEFIYNVNLSLEFRIK